MTIKFKKPLYSKKREVKIVVHKDLRAKAMPYPAKKEIMYNEKIEEKWPVNPNNQSNPNDTDVLT